MPKPPRPSASEVLRHNLLILVGLPSHNPQINSPYDPLSVRWRISSVGRASAHHAKGPGFDPPSGYVFTSLIPT